MSLNDMKSYHLIFFFSFCFANIEFVQHELNTGHHGIVSISAADINGDKYVDLIYSSFETNSIIWLEIKLMENINHILYHIILVVQCLYIPSILIRMIT